MFRYEKELSAIKQKLDDLGEEVEFRPATAEDMDYLRGLLYPQSVIEFYEQAEPSTWVEIEDVELNTVADMWGENEDTLPGDRVLPMGLLNVATSIEGDTYCVDIGSVEGDQEPAVLWVSHVVREGMSDGEVRAHTRRMADTFGDFLMRFAKGELRVTQDTRVEAPAVARARSRAR